MTSYVENETSQSFSFDEKALLDRVAQAVLDSENCPYETTVNLLLTDDAGIREYNKNYRNIDAETDVLSFPNLEFGRHHSERIAGEGTGGGVRAFGASGVCLSSGAQSVSSVRLRPYGAG